VQAVGGEFGGFGVLADRSGGGGFGEEFAEKLGEPLRYGRDVFGPADQC
jgi:hypothetical protein